MDGVMEGAERLAARLSLLEQEKAWLRRGDELAAARRALPPVAVKADYVFAGEAGPVRLPDLFAGKPQLIVQHFMFGPDWEEGCALCSMMADHVGPMLPHLAARGIAFAAISRAPLARLLAYRERLGWRFPWLSSLDTSFNFDFGVSFTREDVESGMVPYNYSRRPFPHEEAPGISAFLKDRSGAVLHAYSTYGRGVETMMGVYRLIDIAPMGRDEDGLDWPMQWVRRNDEYKAGAQAVCCG